MDAQDANPTTLRMVLTQPKAAIPCEIPCGRSKPGLVGPNWPSLDSVKIWHDFTLATLNESYGDILDLAVAGWQPLLHCQETDPTQSFAIGTIIENYRDVECLVKWNALLMDKTLKLSKEHMDLSPGVHLRCSYVAKGEHFGARIPGVTRSMVDHVVWIDDYPDENLVIGLGRTSAKWSGRRLATNLATTGTNNEMLWPATQLANVCRRAGTRYGYIQTDDELSVFRFSQIDPGALANGQSREPWQAEMMPIPRSRHGSRTLTADLALWWLSMLALSDGAHRRIVGTDDMVPISDWDTVFDEEKQQWIRRHRYSCVERPTDPPPPPAYQIPSPGNMAAWQAGVGLHADDTFTLNGLNSPGRYLSVGFAGMDNLNIPGMSVLDDADMALLNV